MYLIIETKQGFYLIELRRRVGVTQTTAGKIGTELANAMRIAGERDNISRCIEMDDAHLCGSARRIAPFRRRTLTPTTERERHVSLHRLMGP